VIHTLRWWLSCFTPGGSLSLGLRYSMYPVRYIYKYLGQITGEVRAPYPVSTTGSPTLSLIRHQTWFDAVSFSDFSAGQCAGWESVLNLFWLKLARRLLIPSWRLTLILSWPSLSNMVPLNFVDLLSFIRAIGQTAWYIYVTILDLFNVGHTEYHESFCHHTCEYNTTYKRAYRTIR